MLSPKPLLSLWRPQCWEKGRAAGAAASSHGGSTADEAGPDDVPQEADGPTGETSWLRIPLTWILVPSTTLRASFTEPSLREERFQHRPRQRARVRKTAFAGRDQAGEGPTRTAGGQR